MAAGRNAGRGGVGKDKDDGLKHPNQILVQKSDCSLLVTRSEGCVVVRRSYP